MRKKDCFYLGKVAKKYSFKGEVLVYLDTDEPELYTELESMFVEINGHLVPFFIEKSSIHREKFLRTQFEDMDSEEIADTIVGKDVYLPLTMLPKLEGNKFYYHEIVGFDAIDQRLGNFGTILRISDNGVQALFEVQKNDAVILIPLIDEFIIEVNRENRSILFNTPEGLIDLYI
ncbi:MAG: ribosome maturation factor RimM [Myroides sp.]